MPTLGAKSAALLVGIYTCLLCQNLALSHSGEKHDADSKSNTNTEIALAPGYGALNYEAPIPGSYELPVLGEAKDGLALASTGEKTSLAALMQDKITVLSFIYRSCNDVNGCPLATYVLQQVRQQLETETELVPSLQLISMSFDPVNDTPAAMAEYKSSLASGVIDWKFLTAPSMNLLEPVLSDYGQPLSRAALEDDSAAINHLLRVYLIDSNRKIRNIYSASFLHADTLISDIKTLAYSSVTDQQSVLSAVDSKELKLPDARPGYNTGAYTSQSVSLTQTGKEADLLSVMQQSSLGMPPLEYASALTKEKIALGRTLFFDRRLSINRTFSCAMCHIPQQGFTSNELGTSVGVEGRTVKRNAPTILNVGLLDLLFHDGRESKLEQQIWSPLLAHNEMANPSVGFVLDTIAALPEYRDLFTSVYGEALPSMQALGDALAAYQRVLVAGNSPFDRWRYGGESDALTSKAKLGYAVFIGKGGCGACHTVEEDHALFTDQQLHNTGVGFAHSMRNRNAPHAVTLAPGIVVEVDPAVYRAAAEPPPNDIGRYEVTLDPADRWKFKTPSLRNVSLTAPYMHNGSLATLEEVVEFYDAGGISNPLLSTLIKPLHLSLEEKEALIGFMHSLQGDFVNTLIADGMAAPVGDVIGNP